MPSASYSLGMKTTGREEKSKILPDSQALNLAARNSFKSFFLNFFPKTPKVIGGPERHSIPGYNPVPWQFPEPDPGNGLYPVHRQGKGPGPASSFL